MAPSALPLKVISKPVKGKERLLVLMPSDGNEQKIQHVLLFEGLKASFVPSSSFCWPTPTISKSASSSLSPSGSSSALASAAIESVKNFALTSLVVNNERDATNDECYGCYGVLPIDSDHFAIFITGAASVGTLADAEIMTITEVKFISLTSDAVFSSKDHSDTDSSSDIQTFHICLHLAKILASGSFYFSPQRDFTLSLQKQFRYKEQQQQHQQKLANYWEMTDKRFFWNQYALKDLIQLQSLDPSFSSVQQSLLVPVFEGLVEIGEAKIQGSQLKVALISRVGCLRTGARFLSRGVDDHGQVANFVETEQIICVDQTIWLSFVQIRGTIPAFWTQKGFQIGAHKVELSRGSEATYPAFKRHIDSVIAHYGKGLRIVNLVAKSGGEETLGKAYSFHLEAYLRESQAYRDVVGYSEFDFHAKCKGTDFTSVDEILMKEIDQDIKRFQFFAQGTGQTFRQMGVVRTNCVDCLDRTNVVQSHVAQFALNDQLAKIQSKISGSEIFSELLSDMWADNGDRVALLYAGTGALRADVTRTGKRTVGGAVHDVVKNVNRFYLNNFQDETKQALLDLMLGKTKKQEKTLTLQTPILRAINIERQIVELESRKFSPLTMHLGTWNVNGRSPPDSTALKNWFNHHTINSLPDLYVLGLQECVSQVNQAHGENKMQWQVILEATLNPNPIEKRYALLSSEYHGGNCLFVFIKKELVENVHNVDSQKFYHDVPGRIGAVGIRFDYFESNLCFIGAHFISDQKNIKDRNKDYHMILEGMRFTHGWTIPDHEFVFWLGDLNYRIDLDRKQIKKKIKASDLATLYKDDQLKAAKESKNAFVGFSEGPLDFPPTFKYGHGSLKYDKLETPAWCDRILWAGEKVFQVFYDQAEIFWAHRPIKARFQVEVAKIDANEFKAKILEKYAKKFADQEEIQIPSAPVPPFTALEKGILLSKKSPFSALLISPMAFLPGAIPVSPSPSDNSICSLSADPSEMSRSSSTDPSLSSMSRSASTDPSGMSRSASTDPSGDFNNSTNNSTNLSISAPSSSASQSTLPNAENKK